MLKIFYRIMKRGSGNPTLQTVNIERSINKRTDGANNKKMTKRTESKTDKERTVWIFY